MKTSLMYAASMGRLEGVILLLELEATPYLTSAEGFTAMFEALINNRHDVLMHFLTSATIEPYTVTVGGIRHTALMHIQCFTTIDSVRALLRRHDIDINERDQKGLTVLSHVLVDPTPRQPGWRADVARLILAVPNSELNAVDELHRSYIQQLLGSPRFDEGLLEILLGADVDLENQDRAGETAIFNAICQQPTTKAARMLLDRGANLDVRNHAHTGLIHRIVGYYLESDAIIRVKSLLEMVPDFVNGRDSRGRTALHRALFLGQMQLVQVLLAHNPDIDMLDEYGRTAFDVACQYGRVYPSDANDADRKPTKDLDPDRSSLSVAQHLMRRLISKATRSELPLPAWALAYTGDLGQLLGRLKNGNLDMLEASPDDQNTALHILMTLKPATTKAQKEILALYLETSDGCSPRNIRDETPLHIATNENNLEMAEILIRNGADLKAQDSSGRTPLDLAKALERSAITILIRQALDQDVDLQESSEVEKSQPQPLTAEEYPTQQFVSDSHLADVDHPGIMLKDSHLE
ncbi:hypothetical protein KCU98_g701, partial [Aureobasidium melanogenum]